MIDTLYVTRRSMVAGLTATTALLVAGCREGRQPSSEVARESSTPGQATVAAGATMTVYRDASCGCCEAWAGIARDAGYKVELIDHPNIAAIKRQNSVPDELLSCHTTIVSGYAIEGHVPLGDVDRLLRERPTGVKGLAVPGMPRGSPGMEMPDGAKDRFEVLAFDAAGKTSVFSTA